MRNNKLLLCLLVVALPLVFVGLMATATVAAADEPLNFQAAADLDLDADVAAKLKTGGEKFEFQAEVNRMMNLIIHSLYKTKEIFLRELISNASDALDKIRLLSLKDAKVLGENRELNITVRADPVKRTLTITDTGVGMTKKDLVKNLGTIAKSGTAEFLSQLENKGADSHLIGQFGVGFYAAFLVADTVTVVSKHNDDKQHIWQSTAESDFTVIEDPRGDTLGRGTKIVLQLKEDADEYLKQNELEDIIHRYSQFINFPIYLYTNKSRTVEVPVSEEEKSEKTDGEGEANDEDDAAKVEEVEDKEVGSGDEKMLKVERWTLDWELMNTHKPIWTRDPKKITEKEYHEFFKAAISKDVEDPISYSHFKAEGDAEFKSILYIPARPPPGFLQNADVDFQSIKLFVKRVFITDELTDFLPKYLGFLKGVVDADDLPLNVSRETLQQHRLLRMIRSKIVRKALELIGKLSEDEEKYDKFLEQYGVAMKLGAMEDKKNRKTILNLLRFNSSSQTKRTSFADYIKRMKKQQPQIYYLTGMSMDEIKRSPFVERTVARGYEVLFMDHPIDEYLLAQIQDFDGKFFQNVAKEGLRYGDEDNDEKEKQADTETRFKPLMDFLKEKLSQSIDKVTISNRLTTSPMAIVAPQHGWSGNLERMMAAQAYKQNDPMATYQMSVKKVLEINPKHPLIENLLKKVEADDKGTETVEIINTLYELTALRSGYTLKDPVDFTQRIERVIRTNLGVDPNAKADLDDIKPAPEKDGSEDEEKPTEATDDDSSEEDTAANEESVEEVETQSSGDKEGDDHDEL